jgi:hypothetical protein
MSSCRLDLVNILERPMTRREDQETANDVVAQSHPRSDADGNVNGLSVLTHLTVARRNVFLVRLFASSDRFRSADPFDRFVSANAHRRGVPILSYCLARPHHHCDRFVSGQSVMDPIRHRRPSFARRARAGP